MKSKPEYSFIDLARLGRTDWRAVVLTILLIALVSIVGDLIVLMLTGWSRFVQHFNPIHIVTGVVFNAAGFAGTFGFWLACRWILKRQFRSLISVDLRFRFRRILLGAALYVPTILIAIVAMSLYLSLRYGTWVLPFRGFVWPHSNSIIGQIFGMAITAIGICALAFSEELFFRGWLTQTLGQYIRSPLIVIAIVAVLFAVYHTQYDLRVKVVMAINSLAFSALSLRDRRLELAIGIHTMLNAYAAAQRMFLTGPLPHLAVAGTVTMFDWVAFDILKSALPFALMYWFLQKTNGWFNPDRTALVADVQRV